MNNQLECGLNNTGCTICSKTDIDSFEPKQMQCEQNMEEFEMTYREPTDHDYERHKDKLQKMGIYDQ